MTNTTTNTIIKVTEGTMAGDVFYGSFNTQIKGKTTSVMVSNHIKDLNMVNIQVKVTYDNGVEYWHNVFTTKGNKWHGIDKGFLDVLTVGDMRSSFPEMCDMNIWEMMGAKTWADKSFTKS